MVTPDGDRYILLDGYARVRALRALGRDEVDALLLALPEAEALVLSHRLVGSGSIAPDLQQLLPSGSGWNSS